MVYGIFRPLSQRWRFIEGDLDLSTMQDYVSETQWEVADDIPNLGDYSEPINKVPPAYIECVQ